MPDFIASIPDAVWAALMASSLTLLGVLIANRHFAKQQKLELEYRKVEAAAEREFEMRRSVYLDAAAEVTTAFKHISNLPHIDSAKDNVSEPLDGFFVAVNKACLVASKETVELLNDFIAEYTRVFLKLVFKTSPIQDARITRDIQNDLYTSSQADVNRLLQKSAHFNEELKSDERQWQVIQDNLDFHVKRSSEAAEKRDEAWGLMNSLSARFVVEMLPDLKHLGTLVAPVYVAIRREIGLDSDIEAIERSFEIRFAAVSEQLETLIGKLEYEAE